MHADLLVDMAAKGTDLVDANRSTPDTLPELLYPLDRARSFAAEAARRSGDHPPESLRAFEALLAAYAELCGLADESRRAAGTPPTGVQETMARVRDRAADVHRALAAEGRA